MPALSSPLLLVSLLITISWAFWPGISGGFVFDDYPNLSPLETLGQLSTMDDWIAFVFSNAHFPGRPLSLFTFALDDSRWPWDITRLKLTNIGIHLINTLLVFILTTQILKTSRARTTGIAIVITAIWALHPIQVSTVSYIIQRMTSLSTMFVLMGLILYIRGRQTWPISATSATWSMSLGIILCGGLATLAKENGILICLYAWTLEATVLRTMDAPPKLRVLRHLLLTLPLALLAIYLVASTHGFTRGYDAREFNALERLLTQGRILCDYLAALLMPDLQSGSLYHDDYVISRSLISPLTTLFAWALILALIGLAIRMRRKNELLAFGVLFFFAGHTMESTLLPLELYFEHRNYLPQLGIWILIVGTISDLLPERLKQPISACLLSLLAVISHEQAKTWGNSQIQTTIWYRQNPDSIRNAYQYAKMQIETGQYEEALQTLKLGMNTNSSSLLLPLAEAIIKCNEKKEGFPVEHLSQKALTANYDATSLGLLRTERQKLQNAPPACNNISFDSLELILEALSKNRKFMAGNGPDIHAELAMIAFRTNRPAIVMEQSLQAYRIRKDPTYMINAGWAAYALGNLALARNHLAEAQASFTGLKKWRQPELQDRLNELESAINKAAGSHKTP